jgi:hypothetical protein
MALSKTPLKIDEVAPRFSQLLSEAGTSSTAPTLQATWNAFVSFCHEPVECDDERLFFEADLSSSKPDSFYVHFARTCYGREPKGHMWSHEVICDFLFTLDPALEEFNCTVEAEDLVEGEAQSDQEKSQFFQEVKEQDGLWEALLKRQPIEAEIYVGES